MRMTSLDLRVEKKIRIWKTEPLSIPNPSHCHKYYVSEADALG